MIKVSTSYYNKEEAELFKSYPNYQTINGKIQSDISIPKSEFLASLMFTEQANEDGWRSYDDLKDRVQHRLGDIEDILDFDDDSIKTNHSSQRINASGLTERLGVSLGLNVVNQFHGFSEADWAITEDEYIDGKRLKDFDYQISMASDGQKFIQVENKGNVCADNSKKNSSVSRHYNSIKEKKSDIITREKSAGIPRHQNIYYGTIGVIDSQNKAKVWLVDPIAFNVEWNPRKFKLISRLSFYANLFAEIGVHKRILIPLLQKIELLKETDNIDKFDKVRLEGIQKTPRTFFSAKNFVKINTNEAFGSFFFVKTEKGIKVFLMAITKEILKLIISQDFEEILSYNYKNADLNEKAIIEMSTKLTQATEEFEMTKTEFVLDEKRKRLFAQYYGSIEHTSSGRIFGIIN